MNTPHNRGYAALVVILILSVIGSLIIKLADNGPLSSHLTSSADSALAPKYDTLYKKNPPKYHRKSQKALHIELNSADSATLCQVYGIGPTFAHRIIKRRDELGGFYRVEQLKEVRGIDNEAYERVAKNFFVDTALILKININFADRKRLVLHPYITISMAKRVEKARMRGGYITDLQEVLEKNILLPQEAQKVAPYLSFSVQQKN